MKLLKRALLILAALTAVFFIVGFLLPSEYSVERKTTINAPVEQVFAEVNDLEKYNEWSPWKTADPTMKITYGDSRVGEGAWYSWTSENSGEGKLVIENSEANKRIDTDLDFGEMGLAKGYWTFVEDGDSVELTWGFNSDAGNNIAIRYFALGIDSMVGPQFEQGLAEIKKRAEAAAGS